MSDIEKKKRSLVRRGSRDSYLFPTLCFSHPTLDLSIVIPVRDEEGNILQLAQEVEETMLSVQINWECIWVDDGSVDGTMEELQQICCEGSPHRFLAHVKGYGQSAALATGFTAAKGELFAMLDGDGQNDPKFLPLLLQELQQHRADMVNGWRKKRQESLKRRAASFFGNLFRNKLLGEHTKDVGCSLRVFRRECLEHLFLFDGFHRFIPSLARLNGYRAIREVAVQHRARQKGKSKYTIRHRLFAVILDTLALWWMKQRLVRPLFEGNGIELLKEENER